jgi:hypothetical protein
MSIFKGYIPKSKPKKKVVPKLHALKRIPRDEVNRVVLTKISNKSCPIVRSNDFLKAAQRNLNQEKIASEESVRAFLFGR